METKRENKKKHQQTKKLRVVAYSLVALVVLRRFLGRQWRRISAASSRALRVLVDALVAWPVRLLLSFSPSSGTLAHCFSIRSGQHAQAHVHVITTHSMHRLAPSFLFSFLSFFFLFSFLFSFLFTFRTSACFVSHAHFFLFCLV